MKTDDEPIRRRRPGSGALLNAALLPTALLHKDEQPPIRIEALETPSARGPVVAAALVVLLLRLVVLRLRGRLDARAVGRHVTAFCLRMGVLWIKVAQFLSMRMDLLPLEVVEELATLQDRASGFPSAAAVQVIEEELGASLDQLFTEFDPVPLAAASIAQVHRARLKDSGIAVVIKVRRPHIEQTFASDMRVLGAIVRVLNALSVRPQVGWDDMLWEAEAVIEEELDYRSEATNQRRLRRSLRRHDVYVPKVFSRFCRTRVLVMEYVPGVLMSDYIRVARTDPARLEAWQQTNNVEPIVAGRRLLTSYLRQLLEDNLFHSDLHPGNLMLLRDSRLAFLDFGSLGTTEREFLRRYELYLEALVEGRHAAASDVFLLFSRFESPIDVASAKQELVEAMQGWHTRASASALPYEERSTSRLADQLVRILDRHGITLNWTFLRIVRAWTTMDASLRTLAPRQDLRPVMARYFRRRDRRAGHRVLRSLATTIEATSPLEVPRLLYEYGVFRGTVVRRLGQVFEGSTTVAAQLVGNWFKWLARAAMLLGLALFVVFLVQYGPARVQQIEPASLSRWVRGVPRMDPQVWVLVFAVLVYSWRTSRHLRRRFAANSTEGDHGQRSSA